MSHRDALLEAARQLVVERGFGRTTARDLVAASDTNLGSIGYHFGSKDALLNEAIHALWGEWTEQIQRSVRGEPGAGPLEQFAGAVRAMADGAPAHRELAVAWFEAVLQATRDPDAAETTRRGLRDSLDVVAADVRAALGDDVDDAVARNVALLICAICDGLLVQHLVDPGRFPSGDELVASLGTALAMAVGRLQAGGA